MYKKIFNEDHLHEMANLKNNKTGLSHGTIYISTSEGNHGPRVKFFKGRPGSYLPSASITISDIPTVVEDSIGITINEKNEIIAFININKEKLLKIWNYGNSMYSNEFDKIKNSLKKI